MRIGKAVQVWALVLSMDSRLDLGLLRVSLDTAVPGLSNMHALKPISGVVLIVVPRTVAGEGR